VASFSVSSCVRKVKRTKIKHFTIKRLPHRCFHRTSATGIQATFLYNVSCERNEAYGIPACGVSELKKSGIMMIFQSFLLGTRTGQDRAGQDRTLTECKKLNCDGYDQEKASRKYFMRIEREEHRQNEE
jgi:hypothetical protein